MSKSLLQLDHPNRQMDALSENYDGEKLDAHVVILNNYLRIHHVVSYVELAKRVRKLTILISVPMEPDRDWDAEWMGLDVRIQKNWMFTKSWKHSKGFQERNFIHVPVDTVKQLKSLKPDIVFSYEMGFRTLLSGWFRRWNKKVPLVMVGNMSEGIEQERGFSRRLLRSFIRRVVDVCSYNGPSCKRYLKSIGLPDEKLFHIPYCIDPDVVFTGERSSRADVQQRKLLYCGSISPRKGVTEFASALRTWCNANPERQVVLQLAGAGELVEQMSEFGSANLKIQALGNLNQAELAAAYRDADIGVNPSFADEWGLTTVEALASGMPVLGCTYVHSIEAVIDEGVNGWTFESDDPTAILRAIESAMSLSGSDLDGMVQACRQSVQHITPQATAERFCDVVTKVLPESVDSATNRQFKK
jgi:glycosyltransferase involved in cell wall biosynthesis